MHSRNHKSLRIAVATCETERPTSAQEIYILFQSQSQGRKVCLLKSNTHSFSSSSSFGFAVAFGVFPPGAVHFYFSFCFSAGEEEILFVLFVGRGRCHSGRRIRIARAKTAEKRQQINLKMISAEMDLSVAPRNYWMRQHFSGGCFAIALFYLFMPRPNFAVRHLDILSFFCCSVCLFSIRIALGLRALALESRTLAIARRLSGSRSGHAHSASQESRANKRWNNMRIIGAETFLFNCLNLCLRKLTDKEGDDRLASGLPLGAIGDGRAARAARAARGEKKGRRSAQGIMRKKN